MNSSAIWFKRKVNVQEFYKKLLQFCLNCVKTVICRCIGLNRPIRALKSPMPMRVPMQQKRENRRRCIGLPMHRDIPSIQSLAVQIWYKNCNIAFRESGFVISFTLNQNSSRSDKLVSTSKK